MQSEPPLTLILSPLRAGRGEVERSRLGSLFGDPGKAPPTGSPLPLEKGEGQGEGSFGYGLARGGRRVPMSETEVAIAFGRPFLAQPEA